MRRRCETLLEAGLLLREVQASEAEALRARERNRLQFERAIRQSSRSVSRSASRPLSSRLLGLVASIVLVSLLTFGGAGILAQTSLPGNTLYGLKLYTESLRLTLSNQDPALVEAFAERRIDEARQILNLGREANLQFGGRVEAVGEGIIWIEGLRIRVPDARTLAVGDRLMLRAYSTTDGQLIATEIDHLDEETVPPVPLATPAQRRPRQPSNTPLPTQTARPSETATPLPSETDRPTRSASPSPTPSPGQNARLAATATGTDDCNPTAPDGWLRYTVQAGDTASELAASTGLTVDELSDANCIEDARRLIVGQELYLPHEPQRRATTAPNAISSATPEFRNTDAPNRQQEQQRGSDDSQRDDSGSDGSGRDSSGGNGSDNGSGSGGSDDSGRG